MSTAARRIDKVSILILSWNGKHHLEHCLPAVVAQKKPSCEVEILVLDNGSHDGTVAWLEARFPEVKLIASPINLGFCGGNLRLAEAASGDALILLNNDTRPQPEWLAELVEALAAAPADVAAVSGGIVDWQGERLDFARGLMTFDGHAFQLDYRRPLAGYDWPSAGTELPFACGGNMIVRRDSFFEAGAFDRDYFAYLEDVDLGWRLWAGNERVIFAPNALVHHRSMATSELLGNDNRGFLFERNAFLTAYKNLDAELFPKLMPAIFLTLIHRTQTLLVQNNPGGDLLTMDPYAGLIANTGWPAGTIERIQEAKAQAAPIKGPSLAEKWRSYGSRELAKRALRKAARLVLPKFVFDQQQHATQIQDPRTLAQLRAIAYLIGHLDQAAAKRERLAARRKRPDRDYFERFPPAIVPTYPGDEKLFASPAFADALPSDLEFRRYRLDEVMVTS